MRLQRKQPQKLPAFLTVGYWRGPSNSILWKTGSYRQDYGGSADEWRDYVRENIGNSINQEIRKAGFTPSGYDSIVTRWHRDGTDEYYKYMVIWSNNHPTEIRWNSNKNRKLLLANYVYVFDNNRFEHRTPRIIPPDRVFARAYITAETVSKLIGAA